VPIFQAFVRPPTILGCDPRVISLAATLSACLLMVGVMRVHLGSAVLGGVLFAAAVVGCNVAGKRDPQWLDVWFRSIRYRRRYDRVGRWDARVPRRRSW
jgi:type IV secretory pathway TrbD component